MAWSLLLFLSPGVLVARCGCRVSTSTAFAPILLPHELELNVGIGVGVPLLGAIRAVRLHLRATLRLCLARGLRQRGRSGHDDRSGENECDLHPAPPLRTARAPLARGSRGREWGPLNPTSRSSPRLPACRRENRRSRP